VCAQFISSDVEWCWACPIVSGQKNFSPVHVVGACTNTRTQRVLHGVARWRRSATVLASPHSPSFETKFYKTAESGNTPKEPRCYLPLIRAEPPKQFGLGPVRIDSQNHSSAPGRPFLHQRHELFVHERSHSGRCAA